MDKIIRVATKVKVPRIQIIIGAHIIKVVVERVGLAGVKDLANNIVIQGTCSTLPAISMIVLLMNTQTILLLM